MTQSLQEIAKKAKPVLKKNGITFAGVFGSFSRGEQTKKSDIDMIIEATKGMGLFEFIGLKHQLEKALHCKVDLGTKRSLSKYIKKQALADLKVIYGKQR